MNALPEGYRLSFDPADADPAAAHAYLTRSYWAPGIPVETVARALDNSLCCTVHDGGGQVGLARVISDFATFAYLSDVYVLEQHQEQGLAKAMLAALHVHPRLQGLRRWMLFTRDAHSLYAGFGWKALAHPERAMLLDFPEVYS
ncbi:MAG: GNAT family N-acetyltransferase [Novosphingobium sp.]|nr:GNAT family N-acetyltransferase [Novosphingobium sp.]